MFAGQASDTKSFHSSTTNVFPYTESSCDIENRVVQLTQISQMQPNISMLVSWFSWLRLETNLCICGWSDLHCVTLYLWQKLNLIQTNDWLDCLKNIDQVN